jgi:prepilin-type N-terminal cleavage/methylation domain-containing protein
MMNDPQPAVEKFSIRNAFTLVEVMVVVVLLSLIVLALMAVFDSTQKAFKASMTQTDLLEGGRAAMDMMAADLRTMTPSRNDAVNFYVAVDANYQPLVQSLVASSNFRKNILEDFFILRRENQTWKGVGYAVCVSPTNLYTLYRFSSDTNAAADPMALYNSFTNAVYSGRWTNMSRLMDGVVHLTVRAFDYDGVWLTNGYASLTNMTIKNVHFFSPNNGEVGFYMTNNALPPAVEIELAALEDRTLQRAESLGNFSQMPWANVIQWTYLTNSANKVHIFRQRVSIPNVDPTAYSK